VIDIWGEIYLTTDTSEGGQLLRGHPAFDRYGELFDWVVVEFEAESGGVGVAGPAKLMAFYKDPEGIDRAELSMPHISQPARKRSWVTPWWCRIIGLSSMGQVTLP
jgi:hypothetical protein